MKKENFLFIALGFLFLFGCKKNEDDNNSGNVANYLQSIAGSPQQFSFNSSTGATITGQKGTRLVLPPNTFYFKKNNNPANGQISVQVHEIYDKKGLILWNKPTVSNGEMLVSGGVAYVKMTIENEEVYSTDASLQFIAEQNGEPMRPFGWNDTAQTWIQLAEVDNGPVSLDTNTFYYNFNLPSNYYWINCDYFNNSPGPFTNVTVEIPGSHNESDDLTMVFFVFMNQFSVTGATKITIKDQYRTYNIPINMQYKLVAAQIIDNKINAAFSEVKTTAQNSPVIVLNPEPMDNQTFRNLLENL